MSENDSVGMIRQGLEELEKIYSEEKGGKEPEISAIKDERERIKNLSERLEDLSDKDTVSSVKEFADRQIKILEIISDKIDRFESEDKESLAEHEHSQRHGSIGIIGGIIQYSVYLTDEEDQKEDLEEKMSEIKSYASS